MLAATLPDLSRLDREALQTLLLAEHEERIATHQQLLQRESEIETLKLLLSQLRRMQFGRKSEKLQRHIEQLELRLEDLQLLQAAEQIQGTESGSAESSAPAAKGKAGSDSSGKNPAGIVRDDVDCGNCRWQNLAGNTGSRPLLSGKRTRHAGY